MIQKGKANTFETCKDRFLRKEKQTIFKKQNLVTLKNTVMEMKVSPEGPNSRMAVSEKSVSELEDISIEIIQSKQQEEKNGGENE